MRSIPTKIPGSKTRGPLLFSIVLDVSARATAREGNKVDINRKGRSKSIPVCRCIIYIRDCKGCAKTNKQKNKSLQYRAYKHVR